MTIALIVRAWMIRERYSYLDPHTGQPHVQALAYAAALEFAVDLPPLRDSHWLIALAQQVAASRERPTLRARVLAFPAA